MAVPNKFELAIKAAGMTKRDAKNVIGLKSYQAISDRLENPLVFRLSEIQSLANAMNATGKELLKEAVEDIFLPSNLS